MRTPTEIVVRGGGGGLNGIHPPNLVWESIALIRDIEVYRLNNYNYQLTTVVVLWPVDLARRP